MRTEGRGRIESLKQLVMFGLLARATGGWNWTGWYGVFLYEQRQLRSTVLPTLGVRLNLRLIDGHESAIEVMWRASDLVECLIFIGLALMFARTAFVTVRLFRRYFLACGVAFVSFSGSAPASEQSKKNLAADLNRGAGTLQSITFAAPFLGLAGTCYGILCVFSRGYVGSRGLFISALSLEISVALVATAAGLIVAIPAAISYNILRTCVEKFEYSRSSTLLKATPRSYGFAQTLPLRRRFSGLPAFALIGASVLALLIPTFALFQHFLVPIGLPVRLLRSGVEDHDSSPIVVSVIGASVNSVADVYVNSKETSWAELRSTIRSQLEVRSRWIVYVEAKSNTSWNEAVYAIDVARGLHAEVVLLTTTPNIESGHAREAKTKKARAQ